MMLLMLVQILAKQRVPKIRLAFGALVASLLVPITIFFPDAVLVSPIGKICYAFFIIICSFGYRSLTRLMKLVLLFYFVSFSVGGGLFAAHFMLQRPFALSNLGFLTYQGGFGDPISWSFVIIGFPIIWYFTKQRMDRHAVEKLRYDQLYPVSITMKDITFSTAGFLDSGNQLVDPISKKPVVICDAGFLSQWFTDEEWLQMERAYEHLEMDQIPNGWESIIQLIPYYGVAGKNGFLLALRPDQIVINYHSGNIETNRVLIGIQFQHLVKDYAYQCLLHPQIIQLEAVHPA